MSHGKIREDKICLNCGHFVKQKFCPNCGQENTENRKPFHYLFTHFVEDFTHYDGQFWGTIKNLLFKPGKLTQIYLEGKRQRFVPPVKLYIFMSFVAFLLYAWFPPFRGDLDSLTSAKNPEIMSSVIIPETQKILDSLQAKPTLTSEDSAMIARFSAFTNDPKFYDGTKEQWVLDKGIDKNLEYKGFKDRKSYDSANANNHSIFLKIDRQFAYKFFELKEKGLKMGEILKRFATTIFHNLPKALFIYLPFFAFFLWIFHNKKKWWYFEHGVFTLHYFSFLLLNILAISFLNKIISQIDNNFFTGVVNILIAAFWIYSIVYFFTAHRKVYQTNRLNNFILGTILLFLNFFAFMTLVIGLALVSFLMIH